MKDGTWIEEVYLQHEGHLRSYARRLTCTDPYMAAHREDLVQEVFLLCMQKEEALCDHPNLAGWLIQAMQYVYRNARRRRQLEQAHACPETPVWMQEGAFQGGPEPEDLLCRREGVGQERIRALVGDEGFGLLVAHCVHRVPLRELARRQGASEEAVRMRLYRIKRKLRNHEEEWAAL